MAYSSKKRVLIDGTSLSDQFKYRGIGSFAREVIKRITADSRFEWHLIVFDDIKNDDFENVTFHRIGPVLNSGIWNPLTFKRKFIPIIQNLSLDLYFSPTFERGIPNKVKVLVAIHDIIPRLNGIYSQKGFFQNELKKRLYNYHLYRALKAGSILTISEFTKEKLHSLAVPNENIHVVHLGVKETFKRENISQNDITSIRKEFSIPKKYMLYYGGLEENKNVLTILKILKENQQRSQVPLVMVTNEIKTENNRFEPLTRQAKALTEVINDFNLPVIIIPTLSEKKLAALVSGAWLFLHLSTMEGFGLSVAEALAAGTPALISNQSCYPELFSRAAILINPYDVAAGLTVIEKLERDPKYRNKIRHQGIVRSNEFQWDKTAKKISALIYEITTK